MTESPSSGQGRTFRFWAILSLPGALYLGLILSMVVAAAGWASWSAMQRTWQDPGIQYSMKLSLISSTLSALLSLWIAVPSGFVLSRLIRPRSGLQQAGGHRFRQGLRTLLDCWLDIPIVLPPLVIGICLLLLFQTSAGRWLDQSAASLFGWLGYSAVRGISYQTPAIVLAQTVVAAAFATRTMRDTFDQINPRAEDIARTLGASPWQSFLRVSLPQAGRGMLAAGTLAWARSLGEFGPILIFAGTMRMNTEVLPTSIYLKFQSGDLQGAIAVSIWMMIMALVVLVVSRWLLAVPASRASGSHRESQ